MDSSNSGSFQSSSGGGGDNDDYDSTTQSAISSFFNPPPSTNFNPTLNHLLQPPPPYTPSPTFYNPSFSTQHPASTWTATATINNLPDFGSYTNNPNNNTSTITIDTQPKTTTHHGSDHQIGVAIKNPKKRTRASRRAPTTVLTTDTTNFRQMVQEFTGIPTAPFTATPFSRLLRPPPFLNSNPTPTPTTNYHQFTPNNNFPKQPSTFLDLQNPPVFSFQSLLQNSLPQSTDSSTKRWTDHNGKFEGVIGNTQNIGGSKLSSGIENVLNGGGDQVQGNEASWICPSS